MKMMTRWIQKVRPTRFKPERQCRYCSTFWGGYGESGCPATLCLYCGSWQCMGNGLSRGQCPICYHGLLDGRYGSDAKCCYKGCGLIAVARGRGRKPVCRNHAEHQGLVYPDAAEKGRRGWIEVEEPS